MKTLENQIPSATALKQWLLDNPNKVLMYRTCLIENNKLVSRNNFEWPMSLFDTAVAPDWNSESVCGQGLHGLTLDQQEPGTWYSNGAWLLVAADAHELVEINGRKSKAHKLTILAIAYTNGSVLIPQLIKELGYNNPLFNETIIDLKPNNNIKAGDHSLIKIGYDCVGEVGHDSAAIAGSHTKIKAGTYSVVKGGHFSKIIAGASSVVIGESTAVAVTGKQGITITGYAGESTAGDYGIAKAGLGGIVSAGIGGCIIVETDYDDHNELLVGQIGKTLDYKGQVLKPDTFYFVIKINEVYHWKRY